MAIATSQPANPRTVVGGKPSKPCSTQVRSSCIPKSVSRVTGCKVPPSDKLKQGRSHLRLDLVEAATPYKRTRRLSRPIFSPSVLFPNFSQAIGSS